MLNWKRCISCCFWWTDKNADSVSETCYKTIFSYFWDFTNKNMFSCNSLVWRRKKNVFLQRVDGPVLNCVYNYSSLMVAVKIFFCKSWMNKASDPETNKNNWVISAFYKVGSSVPDWLLRHYNHRLSCSASWQAVSQQQDEQRVWQQLLSCSEGDAGPNSRC